jgi:hypothetical protein
MCARVGVYEAYEQRVHVCAYVGAHAQNVSERAHRRVRVRAERRAARDGDLSSR